MFHNIAANKAQAEANGRNTLAGTSILHEVALRKRTNRALQCRAHCINPNWPWQGEVALHNLPDEVEFHKVGADRLSRVFN